MTTEEQDFLYRLVPEWPKDVPDLDEAAFVCEMRMAAGDVTFRRKQREQLRRIAKDCSILADA